MIIFTYKSNFLIKISINRRIIAVADPENQRGDGGFSEGMAIMVKKRFSKPIRDTCFYVSAEEK